MNDFSLWSSCPPQQFCINKVAIALLKNLLRRSFFCLPHLFTSGQGRVWRSQKAFAVPLHLDFWPGIGHIQDPDHLRLPTEQRFDSLAYLLNVGSIYTTQDAHTFPPRVARARSSLLPPTASV